jgi:OOP family OmpA-OmpF porin
LLFAGALAGPVPAEEESDLEPHYIDVLGSFVRPDSGRHTSEQGYGASFIYGAHVTGPFWVEGRLTGSIFDTGDNDGTDFYHFGAGIDGVATLGDRTGFTPFGLLGIGAAYDDVVESDDDSLAFRTDFGVGVVSPAFTKRGLKLRAEGRGIYDTFESGQLDWQLSLGISIPLGSYHVVERVVEREQAAAPVQPPVEPAADADQDGVADRYDRCPHTIAGGEVDANGCLRQTGQTIVLDDVTFELGSADLTQSAKTTLDAVAASLVVERGVKFEIAGHTDSSGSDQVNDQISTARANAVRRYLAGKGVAADRMTARGYGEREPVATNDTAEGRARNRRVEFRLQSTGSR